MIGLTAGRSSIRLKSLLLPGPREGHFSLHRAGRVSVRKEASSYPMAMPRCCYTMLHLGGAKAVKGRYERLGEPVVTLDGI